MRHPGPGIWTIRPSFWHKIPVGRTFSGADTNAESVLFVTAGGGASDDDAILLSAHRDADADCHTGARSLPDRTLAVARHVACVKDNVLLGFARVVYVHSLFSSSSAVGGGRTEMGQMAARLRLGWRWRGLSCTTVVPLSGLQWRGTRSQLGQLGQLGQLSQSDLARFVLGSRRTGSNLLRWNAARGCSAVAASPAGQAPGLLVARVGH